MRACVTDAALEIHLPEWSERQTRQADKSKQTDGGRQTDRSRQTDVRQKAGQDARFKTGVKLKGKNKSFPLTNKHSEVPL